MTCGEIERFFAASNGFKWIDLTGGEIFLRPDLADVFDIINRHCRNLVVLHFPTNGQLKENVLRFIAHVQSANKRVQLVITVSLDGPEEVHDSMRGVTGSWRKALDTYIALKERGLKYVYVGYTLSTHNENALESLYRQISRIYPRFQKNDIHVNIMHRSSHYYANDEAPLLPTCESWDNVTAVASDAGRLKGFFERRYYKLANTFLRTGRMPLRCRALSATCFLDPYGDIYPCTIYSHKVCHISEVDYKIGELWNSRKVEEIRENIKRQLCPGCWSPCEAYPAILGNLFMKSERFHGFDPL